MEKASILIKIICKTNGFERRGGSGATRDGKSFDKLDAGCQHWSVPDEAELAVSQLSL